MSKWVCRIIGVVHQFLERSKHDSFKYRSWFATINLYKLCSVSFLSLKESFVQLKPEGYGPNKG